MLSIVLYLRSSYSKYSAINGELKIIDLYCCMLKKLSHMRQFVCYAASDQNLSCIQPRQFLILHHSRIELITIISEFPLEKIKAIHITVMLSVMTHAAFLSEMGGVTSAGKRPMAQPSRMIYIQASMNPPTEPTQPEIEQPPESPPEPEPLFRPKDANKPKPTEKIVKKKTVKHLKPAEPSSIATQPAAPLQQASMTSIVEIQQSYILQALEKIEEQKSYPMQARRRRTSGSVTLSIRVNSTGIIEKLECLQGPASLCRAAVTSAEKAQPFPALPEGTNHLAFEYQMLYKLH